MKRLKLSLLLGIVLMAGLPVRGFAQSSTASAVQPVNATIPSNAPEPPPIPQTIIGLKPVVITARHRAERAQSVPVSLTTVDVSQINTVGSPNLTKLQQLVPSLTVVDVNPRNTSLNIRGLGSVPGLSNDGLESGVGLYVDGVLLARPGEAVFDMPDLQDIEVLRGPQGTLFGKNTVSGAINITTRLPSFTPEADGSISYGTQNYVQLKASASSALFGSDKLAIRLSVEGTQHDGYIRNISDNQRYSDQDDKAVRAQLLYNASSNLTIRVILDYSNQKENCCVPVIDGIVTNYANGAPVPSAITHYAKAGYMLPPINAFGRTTDIDSPTYYVMDTGGATVLADYDLDGFTLSSISAGRFWNWTARNDGDSTGLPILTAAGSTIYQRQASQELRVTSPLGGPVDYTAGLYYFYQSIDTGGIVTYGPAAPVLFAGSNSGAVYSLYNGAINGLSAASNSIYDTNSLAAYGQATWHILPKWDITGGLRYTYEAKTGYFKEVQQGGEPEDGISPASQTVRNAFVPPTLYSVSTYNAMPSGLLTLSYKPTENILAYATYSHGTKSAGINLVTSPVVPKIVAPETIDNYEIGLKTTLFDDRLLLDGDAFWDEDTDYQGTLVSSFNGTPFTYIASIPKVRSRGFEIDSRAQPVQNVSLFFSGVYDNAYNESDPSSPCPIELSNTGVSCNLTGRPLAGVSTWSGSFGGEYDYPLPEIRGREAEAFFSGNALLRSGFYSGTDDSKYSYVPGYGIGNIDFGVKAADGTWSLSGWIRNVTNARYYLYRGAASDTAAFPDYNLITAAVGDPITGGVTLSGKF